jgi:hypothetical protein
MSFMFKCANLKFENLRHGGHVICSYKFIVTTNGLASIQLYEHVRRSCIQPLLLITYFMYLTVYLFPVESALT